MTENAKRHLELRVGILAAIDSALDRHTEVLAAIARSTDREEAITVVEQLLDVDQVSARAVLDLQWSRLTRRDRDVVATELAETRRRLA